MCIPQEAISVIGDTVSSIAQGFSYDNSSKRRYEEYNYRKQIALNNAQNERNNALSAMQEGIEQSRKEKLEGLRKAQKLQAKNSASGFSLNSITSQQQYDDEITQGNNNATDVINDYNKRADNYFSRANSYLNEADKIDNDYNSSAINSGMRAFLGSTGKVSQNWLNFLEDE